MESGNFLSPYLMCNKMKLEVHFKCSGICSRKKTGLHKFTLNDNIFSRHESKKFFKIGNWNFGEVFGSKVMCKFYKNRFEKKIDIDHVLHQNSFIELNPRPGHRQFFSLGFFHSNSQSLICCVWTVAIRGSGIDPLIAKYLRFPVNSSTYLYTLSWSTGSTPEFKS